MNEQLQRTVRALALLALAGPVLLACGPEREMLDSGPIEAVPEVVGSPEVADDAAEPPADPGPPVDSTKPVPEVTQSQPVGPGWSCETACPEGAGFTCTGPEDDVYCSNTQTGEVWVPPGQFWMGCNVDKDTPCYGNDAHPRHLVTLDGFAIDREEVTAAEYRLCVEEGPCEPPSATGGKRGTYDDKPDHPINHVTWYDAEAYCAWSGKPAGEQRLCTEAEWEMVARGSCAVNEVAFASDGQACPAAMRVYPWGGVPASCEYAVVADGGIGCGTNSTWPVGSKPKGASPYGAVDMSGSVWEWVGDWYAEDYYAQGPCGADAEGCSDAWANPPGPESGPGRVIRGYGFHNSPITVRASGRSWFAPADSFVDLGFRCCRSAEP